MAKMSGRSRILGAGSARCGAESWWAQRVTAFVLVPLGAWFCISLLSITAINYPAVTAWVARGWNAALLVAFILAAGQHSYLGLRVVVEDYVDDAGARIAMLLMIRFVYLLNTVGAVLAVFAVVFGLLG